MKFSNTFKIFWATVVGLGVLIGIIVGSYNIYDRFFKKKVSENIPEVKEYIFATQYYYVQVLADVSNKVLVYGVTTRDANFNPSFTMAPDLMYADSDNPNDSSKYKSGATVIILGKTKFGDVKDAPQNIFAYLGAHDFYYHEEYYYGNPANYQSYFLAANHSGYLNTDDNDLSFFNNSKIDPSDPTVIKFRSNSVVNTFYVTAPMEGIDNTMLREYLVGPDYNQVRAIPETLMRDNSSKFTQINRLSKLSTDVDIENIISVLGKPLIINVDPTFAVRTDPTLKQQ